MTYDAHRRLAAIILAEGWGSQNTERAIQSNLKCRKARAADIAGTIAREWRLPYPPSEVALTGLLRRYVIRRRDLPAVVTPPVAHETPFPDVPPLTKPADLADWLGVELGQLLWLADCDGRHALSLDRPGHYTQTFLRKRNGLRLVEAPLPRLKAVQRTVLRGLLDCIPPHPDAYGFVRGRDCRSGAARHAGEAVVICCDLADFFPSVPAMRIHAIFRSIGYSPVVARLLTGLVTTRAPPDVVAALSPQQRIVFAQPHLPQGAPTSPALANLAARRLDVRLSGLARKLGAAYSRYADDLTISGDRGLALEGGAPIVEIISEIAQECGFRLNPAKTRIQRQGGRQTVTGIVVNSHLNLRREDYERLKATLHNCIRHGPETQNRDGHRDFQAHLEGRIAWVAALNPHRATKLYRVFDRIDWRQRE